jgi:hypothetical protein
MADKTGRISGALPLDKIESAIQFEEAKSFEFLTARIENDKDNLADFKKLPLGEFPNELKLTLAMDPAPGGFTPFPDPPIPMIVEGSKKDVKAWRKQ